MRTNKVKKAIIPAAGSGTRLLPATKAMAKEMMPIVDKPTIQLIVEEAVASGIEEILIITGKGKRPIEDHFDANIELEATLREKGKLDLLKLVEDNFGAKIYFVRQPYPKGLGDAVLQAKAFVGNEPFVVLLGDDIMSDTTPLSKQLIDSYYKTNTSQIAVMEVEPSQTSSYGIIDVDSQLEEGLYNVKKFVEKPKPEDAPSNLAIIGRYLLTPDIFSILENLEPGVGGEIQLTDAIDQLNRTQRVFAKTFRGVRYDTGNKLGLITTNIQYGLEHPEVKEGLKQYIIDLAKKLEKE
ncbi:MULTISPECIES: UTP--glucose-1-phosphate uridylyltransferase GalU [unclassified Granulicatella]|uniref:UTP--glucose-1-phosphate uridylyltransferase GalU n=1 Tax=unclassified Granulicatella TaxID=2630493 RepID=UPI001073ACD6|nr:MULTISPECIES: UTP--glucose-1-phosphate uridylyltransferase GalU [unclassified Granulicatella]MBF0779611.1 UTP--glucose-1-phosphate uridylyltransferase GalU [Granulicatella sp. 19428wC4_WM01]TFU96410.1 UTP--glucose-1-phosphate uridylyltransferase GalU [Granulicatella sp. WM01]